MLSTDKTEEKRGKRRQGETPVRNHIIKVADYRHKQEKRMNIPDAGLAIYNYKRQEPVKYDYDPHLDPQLMWAGKAERTSFEVETVSLHIHERVSTQAILKSVQKAEQYRQLRLFAEPDLPLNKRIEFYQHEMDWTNRLILGDSLLVMNSLKERELMEGKVQMIYMDPPYGIKYASNFQPSIDKRNVKDTDDDLTREPEQIQAFRDTWQLGIHSYLTYLRDRLTLCQELLHETGSIFVQINDENLHLVRSLLDEVFGPRNFLGIIAFRKTGGLKSKLLASVVDYIVWYAKSIETTKFHQLVAKKQPGDIGATQYRYKFNEEGKLAALSRSQLLAADENEVFTHDNLTSQGNPVIEVEFRQKQYSDRYKTTKEGVARLALAGRIVALGNTLRYVRYLRDFPYAPITEFWHDTGISGFEEEKKYAVQTSPEVIERCVMMTTDPGDLVLDPTCGSGTTAYCAEKLGRRWITCDTSRVALAIARMRIMTAKFPWYELADQSRGPAGNFLYETAPHATLESIVHNTELEEIAGTYQPRMNEALAKLNTVLGEKWKEWQVPFETISKWPEEAKEAFHQFWGVKKKKQMALDESIHGHATPEMLYAQPKIDDNVVRVSGPFTIEAIPTPVAREQSPQQSDLSADVLEHYTGLTLEILQKSGIIFPGGKQMVLENLRPISSAGFIHGEGETKQNGDEVRVAVSLGPRYGPISAKQVDEAIRSAYKMGFDLLVFAGFAFEPEAQATIHKNPIPKLAVQMAHISPDVIIGAYSNSPLLKTTKTSQLFTVFGEPDVKLEKIKDQWTVKLLGVDLYDPTTGEVHSDSASGIPAWFLDEDYDGYTFRTCQAFFPKEATTKNPWDKLENALRGFVDKEKMEMFRGTESLPFKAGEQKQVAVKVIDIRGNEVMVVKSVDVKETA